MNNKINWNNLIQLNLQEKVTNNIIKCFHENISDKKLDWLNRVFDDIFTYQIFIDEINKSRYLKLNIENKSVVRRVLNADAEEFIPFNIAKAEFIPQSAINIAKAEFIPRILNINAEEYIPQNIDNMELLINSMLNDLIN
jgi:hypothetical protein